MKKFLLATTITVVVAVPVQAHTTHPGCKKTFTVHMVKRAIVKTYWGTSTVTENQFRTLRRFVRCMRNPKAHSYAHWFWQLEARRWRLRRNPPMNGPAIASWYYDSGTTGCGFHATYGIATFVVPCGGRVVLRHGGKMVVAVRDDSGPYVSGRTFDLDPAVKAALGCSDLCGVYWH